MGRGRPSILKYRHNLSAMKEFIFENIIDKENKCKISDREFLRLYSDKLTTNGKPIFTGIWTYWTKHPEIINVEPMKGEKISEEAVYKYAVKQGYWTEEEVPYEEFTKDTQKIKHKLDEITLLRANEKSILGFTQSEALSITTRKRTLLIMCDKDEEKYNKINEKNKKELLKR